VGEPPRNCLQLTGSGPLDEGDQARVADLLASDGWVVCRGLDVGAGGTASLAGLVTQLAGAPLDYRERSSPRTDLGHGVFTSTEYPASEEIHLHNENSYQTDWPMRLFFQCLQPAEEGGATPLADTREVLRQIDPSVRDEFRRRGWRVVRNYHDGFGLSWRDSLGIFDASDLDAFAAAHRLSYDWHGAVLRTSANRAAIHRHPVTGDEVWFNHAVVFHIAAHRPDVRAGLAELFPTDDLPTHTYFGDGAAIPDDVIEHLKDCYAAARFRFDYLSGDVLIIDNMLVAHGREPYRGDRRVMVSMAAPYSEVAGA